MEDFVTSLSQFAVKLFGGLSVAGVIFFYYKLNQKMYFDKINSYDNNYYSGSDESEETEYLDHQESDNENLDDQDLEYENLEHQELEHENLEHEDLDHENLEHENLEHENLDDQDLEHEEESKPKLD